MLKERENLGWYVPGVYDAREQAGLQELNRQCALINSEKIEDLQGIAAGKYDDRPGVQASRDEFGTHTPPVIVTEAASRKYSDVYDPDNPLYRDAEYARKMGYENAITMPGFGYNDHRFMFKMPPEMRDTMVVSGLYHELTFHRPQYPGDRLISIRERQTYQDVTPKQGAHFHTFLLEDWGRVINQDGQLVMEVYDRVCESCASYIAPNPDGKPWMSAPWKALRPAHFYTDQDWDYIKGLWQKEFRRGEEILYWEDVSVGDEPAWTVEGPIDRSPQPEDHYGMGAKPARCSYRKEIMDPETAKTLVRSEKDGIYRAPGDFGIDPPDPSDPFPRSNDPNGDNRDIFINFLGRDLVCRAIYNWMGDHGYLYRLCWGIMPYLPTLEADIPQLPDAKHPLDQVPYMKGRTATTHGMHQDLAICKLHVTKKFEEDGAHYAELVWWIEEITGQVWIEGTAQVRLPSKNAQE